MANIKTLDTLADCKLLSVRCLSCQREIPLSTPVEVHMTQASTWVVATCPSCRISNPYRLEAE
jgi:hypothetical protein